MTALRARSAADPGIDDADTFFGVELPALSAWTFGAEQAAAISQPVLSVLGTDTEPLWIEVADRLRTWIARVEDCTIEGVGHLLHMQRCLLPEVSREACCQHRSASRDARCRRCALRVHHSTRCRHLAGQAE